MIKMKLLFPPAQPTVNNDVPMFPITHAIKRHHNA